MWIESHQSLLRHRKTNQAVRLLGCDRFKLVGHLHALWWWAIDNAPNGEVMAETDVIDGAEWDGNPEHFVSSLRQSGFLDAVPDGYIIHDWLDFTGRLIETRERYRTANRVRQQRYRERRNALLTRDVTPNNGPTVPNLTVPNQDNPSGYADAPPSLPDFSVDEPPETPTPAASVAKRPKGKDSAPTDTPRPPNPVYAILEAYCAGANLDPKTLPGPVKNRYLGQFKALNDAGYSGDQARRCMAYLRTDPYWSARLDSPSTLIDRIAHWHGKGEPETFQPPAANRAGPATPRPPEIEDGETYYRRILATGQPNGDDPRE